MYTAQICHWPLGSMQNLPRKFIDASKTSVNTENYLRLFHHMAEYTPLTKDVNIS